MRSSITPTLIFSQSAERIKMGFILGQIENAYKKVLLSRHDRDDRVFYFSDEDFPGLIKREYPFENSDGYLLKGTFYYYDNPRTDRIIIFDHGLAPGHRSYMREIETICRSGFVVFTFDHTGSGDSEGEHVRGLCGSLCDLDDCLFVLKGIEELRDKKFIVVGHSRGGYSALNILAFHPEVSRIVAMSGFVSVEVMHNQLAPAILVPVRKLIYELERKYNPEYVNCSAFNALSVSDAPALIIHSADDKTVSARANFGRLKKTFATRPNTYFHLVKDRDHNPTFTKEAVEYKHAFFKDLAKIKKQGTAMSEEECAKFVSSYDWYKMTEQDETVWKVIIDFIGK